MSRFETYIIGRYTAEYDREDHTLRLSWTGSQTFLTYDESVDLLNFLGRVLFEKEIPCYKCGNPSLLNLDGSVAMCDYCNRSVCGDCSFIVENMPDTGARCCRDPRCMGIPEVSIAEVAASMRTPNPRPTIVCLCGSTRFYNEFREVNLRETLKGNIVLSIGIDTKSDDEALKIYTPAGLAQVKAMLDELHLRKIDLADEILVLNVGGYIGESTRAEIRYAEEHGKAIRYLEYIHDHDQEPLNDYWQERRNIECDWPITGM